MKGMTHAPLLTLPPHEELEKAISTAFPTFMTQFTALKNEHAENLKKLHKLQDRFNNLSLNYDSKACEANHFYGTFEEAKQNYCNLQ